MVVDLDVISDCPEDIASLGMVIVIFLLVEVCLIQGIYLDEKLKVVTIPPVNGVVPSENLVLLVETTL